MIKTLTTKHKNFQQKFVLAWIGTTLAFIFVTVISLWQYNISKVQHQFDLEARTLSLQLEEVLKDILNSLETVPMPANPAKACKKNLHDIEKIVFGSLYLSGIIISSNDGIILCATEGSLKEVPAYPYQHAKNPILVGPFKVNFSSKMAYYLQKNYGEYLVEGFFVKNVFDNLFKKDRHRFDFTGLYDKNLHKMIYSIGNSSKNLSDFSSYMHDEVIRIDPSNHQFQGILPLSNVDNIELVVSKENLGFFTSFGLQLLLYLLPLLLLSWWFYHYSKQLIRKRFSIDYALYTALKEEQFYPVYQPIFDVSKNCFYGAEVLIRWKTEFNEIILPDYFIEIAEKSGLIVPITLQLMRAVFQECSTLYQKKLPFILSFNLTPAHFIDKSFFNKFYHLCALYSVPPSQITLELTERELFDKSDAHLAEHMQELRNRGFSLSLDDFGTGQANINYLQHFPFNYLKIDKIFIKTIGTGAMIESLNEGIINIARALTLEIIAEGVETEAQVAYLKENNVRYMQGWFFAKAMPFEPFSKLFEK